MRPEATNQTMTASRAALAAALLLTGLSACGGGARNRTVERDAVPLSEAPTRIGDEVADRGDAAAAAEPDGAVADAGAGGNAGADEARGGAAPDAAAGPDDALRPTGAVSWPQGVDDGGSVTIARVGGQDIVLTDLVSKWMLRDPGGVRAILDDLILSQVVKFESGLLGIDLPEAEIDRVVQKKIRDVAAEAKEAGAPSPEAYIQARLGIDAETFVNELGMDAAIDLLAARCVRSWMLASERREFRIIAVDDVAAKQEVQARLDAGEPFEDVARALSVDPTKEDGGRMAPVVRGDQPLARIVFAHSVGEVADPVEDATGFVFVYVESAPEPQEGDWLAIGDAVEASLAERPVGDPEYWQWKDAMFERYDIDISPFLSLLERK